jgi:endopolyphosphatase
MPGASHFLVKRATYWSDSISRHDIDPGHPRTEEEIYSLNRMIVDRMSKIFLSRGVPVVPSIGEFLLIL